MRIIPFIITLICRTLFHQSISNKGYFIGELKFEWPHSKILPGSSSKTTSNISSEWESRKIWFGEVKPPP